MSGNKYYNNRYVYETSPRKLKPDYIPHEQRSPIQKKKSTTLKTNSKNQKKYSKKTKKELNKKVKCVLYLILGFVILFAISYRNSQINESFSMLKETQEQLALIQKENEQLEVSIENSLNLNDLEQIAREQLGMQKATSSQTKYISLPKKDYVEGATEEIQIEENENFIQKIINYILNLF